MNFEQDKLNKSEWDSIEISVDENELFILNLIKSGFNNPNISLNKTLTLFDKLKIEFSENIEKYLFMTYFNSQINKLIKKYNINFKIENFKSINIKNSDKIRINNVESKLENSKDNIFEFIILDIAQDLLSAVKHHNNEKMLLSYYNIYKLMQNNKDNKNKFVEEFINYLLKCYYTVFFQNKVNFLLHSKKFIQENSIIEKHKSYSLFKHQKELFNIIKFNHPKIILYSAPTGTGKTLSPIGLLQHSRVIFLCGARHIGLALARSAISLNHKVAFAFGCNDISDIRLHYFAAKEYTSNYKTGGIFKVDNSIGDNVELIVCDLKSYTYAMNYMNAFNPVENIILYWDEPTISLDSETHYLHDIIKNNWNENIIPNVVLSSATLPKKNDIQSVINNFKNKFNDANDYSINSYEYEKSITILTKENTVALPHTMFDSYSKILKCIDHCKKNKTLLRYFDLQEIINFIIDINDNNFINNSKYRFENYFDSIDMLTIETIKKYYLDLLENIDFQK